MLEGYFIASVIFALNIYTHLQISRDSIYFLDEEKFIYMVMVWCLPLVGSVIAQYRLHTNKRFYITVIGILFFLRYGIYIFLYALNL